MRHVLALLALLALAPVPAHAKEVRGVNLPDTVTAGGQTLRLNGAGLRTVKKAFMTFEVYVGALYLQSPSSDPEAIVAADAPKQVRMVFLRDVSRDQLSDTFAEGFDANSPADAAELKKQLPQIVKTIGNVKEGQVVTVTYAPGEGTTVTGRDGTTTIPGKALADGLFRNWLGPKPANGKLKDAMLGR